MKTTISQIFRSHRRTIALIITPDGQLVVRAPWWATRREIESLVERKQNWITTKLLQAEKKHDFHTWKPFQNGEGFWYMGHQYALSLSSSQRMILLNDQYLLFPARFLNHPVRAMIRWYARQALRHISERVEYFTARNGFDHTGITITGARHRWGSCSHTNRLCFSWRLILLPEQLIDYVVVHELCHTVEKNHSRTFWAEVEAVLPDYKSRRAHLKEY